MGIGPALTRRAALGLFGAAGLVLLDACSSSGADTGGSEKLSIKVQTFTAGTASAIRGSIIEQFGLEKKYGLNVVHAGGSSFTSTLDPLLANVVDASEYGPVNTTNADLKGHDVVVVGPSLYNHARWLVPASSSARSIKDLRGKRVGVQPASSNTYQAAQLAAAVNDIEFAKDFKLFPGEPIASLALFQRGDLDAIIAIEPNATRIVAKGARQLATVSELWQQGTGDSAPLVLQGVGVRRSWLADAKHKADAAAWVKLLTAINQHIHDQPDLLSKYHTVYGVPAAEKAAIALLPKRLPQIYSTDWTQQSFANIDKQVEVAQQLGLVKAKASKPVYETIT